MSDNERTFEKLKEVACEILTKYIDLINDDSELFSAGNVLPCMIEELQEKVLFSNIDPEGMMVRREVRRLTKYDDRFSDYETNHYKMFWITREFHDNHFDFEGFQDGVVESMKEVEKNYEP